MHGALAHPRSATRGRIGRGQRTRPSSQNWSRVAMRRRSDVLLEAGVHNYSECRPLLHLPPKFFLSPPIGRQLWHRELRKRLGTGFGTVDQEGDFIISDLHITFTFLQSYRESRIDCGNRPEGPQR